MGHIRVDPPNTNNKWVGFELANVDTFIIRVRFGLANVDTIRTLTQHKHDPLTRIVTRSFGYENWSDLIDITSISSCSEFQCVIPRKSCIIILISMNPSE